jgi:hypothetical protein
MTRRRLPNRRAHEAFAFTFRGLSYTASVGAFDLLAENSR